MHCGTQCFRIVVPYAISRASTTEMKANLVG